jgi:hypothetical protein
MDERVNGFIIIIIACLSITILRSIRIRLRLMRLRRSGHTTTATVMGYRKDATDRYTPLVTFLTRTGETRSSVPVERIRYTDPPLPIGRPVDLRVVRETMTKRDSEDPYAPAPPIGHVLTITYDPLDPVWADDRSAHGTVIASGLAALALSIVFVWFLFWSAS